MGGWLAGWGLYQRYLLFLLDRGWRRRRRHRWRRAGVWFTVTDETHNVVQDRSVPVYRSMVLPVRNLAVFMRVPHDLLYFSTLYMLLYLLAEIFVPAIYPTAALTIIFYGC